MEINQENNAKQILAEKKITDILSDGLHLFIYNYGKIVFPFIIFLILSNLLIVLCLSQLEWYVNSQTPVIDEILTRFEQNIDNITDQDLFVIIQYILIFIALNFLHAFIGAFFTTISMALISSYLYKKYTKTDETNEKILNKNIFLVLFLIGCCVPAGFLLIIPGILIFYSFIFTLFTYNLKGVNNPAKEARSIAKGSFFNIVIVFLFSVVITLLVTSIYQNIINLIWPVDATTYNTWIDPSNRNYLLLFIYSLINDVAGILLAPLFISVLTVLFATLKAKKDLGLGVYKYPQYYQNTQEIQGSGGYIPIQSQNSINKGIFCPFCGNYIEIIRKFCPNCGESLKDLKS